MVWGDIANLGDWVPKPTVQTAVLAWMEQAEAPQTLAEVAAGSGFDRYACNLALYRLTVKGVLSRYKLPISRPALRGRHTYPTYVYSVVRDDA